MPRAFARLLEEDSLGAYAKEPGLPRNGSCWYISRSRSKFCMLTRCVEILLRTMRYLTVWFLNERPN